MSEYTIVKTVNPLAPQDKVTTILPYEQNITIASLLPTEGKYTVIRNGTVLSEEVYSSTLVKPHDVINVVPILNGGGGTNQILSAIATIAVTAAVTVAVAGLIAMGGWYAFAGYMIIAGTAIAGGMVFNRIFPTKMPSIPSINTNVDSSSTYSWSPQTTQQQGGCVPIIYGRVKATGNIISAYTDTDGEKQYLGILVSLGKGVIHSISDIRLNDQPISQYTGITVETRNGYISQSVISSFNDTIVEMPVSYKLTFSSDVTYSLSSTEYDAVKLVFSCPAGMYDLNKNTGVYSQTVVWFTISYSKNGAPFVELDDFPIYGNQSTSFYRVFQIFLERGSSYIFKVKRNTPDSTSTYLMQDVYLTQVQGISYDDFSYPTIALVGIKALASDQISGSISFSCVVEGKLLNVYNGTSWNVEYSNNPAWVCFDILTRPVFDDTLSIVRYDGIHPSRIDTDSFYEWASFCDELVANDDGTIEKRYTHNRVFDTISNVWEAALSVCSSAQAMLVRSGAGIYVIVDKERNPTALFNMGNIVQGSFTNHFMPLSDRVSSLEITYNDESEDFERTVLKVIDPNDTAYGNSGNISLDGITSVHQAWRLACISLNKNRLLREFAEFKVPMEALASTVGDVIYLSHDVPFWNESGRVVESTSNTVTVDTLITYSPSKTYQILIRDNQTDTIQIKDVVSVTSGNVITIDGSFSTIPSKYDLFSFGEVTNLRKTFQIVKISSTQEKQFTLSCVEYNSDVYTPFLYSSDDRTPTTVNRNVSNLQITSHTEISVDGVATSYVDVYWQHPSTIIAKSYSVYYMSGGVPVLVGSTKALSFSFVAPLLDYITVYVTSVDIIGIEESVLEGANVSFTLNNALVGIPDVQNIWATVTSGILQLDWDDIVAPNLSHYEIRYAMSSVSSWEQATVAAIAKASTVSIASAQSGLYLIKAVSNAGIYSQTPISVYTNIPELQRENNVFSFYEDFTQGVLENLYLEDENTLSMVGVGAFDDIPDLDLVSNLDLYGGVYSEGTYYFENSIVLQAVKSFRCKIVVDYFRYDLDDEFDAISDIDMVSLLGVVPDDVYHTLYVATSTDGILYSDYSVYSGGTLSTRYARFKVSLSTQNPQHYMKVNGITGGVYLFEKVEDAQDVFVPLAGLGATFSVPYESRPYLGITLQGGGIGDTFRILSITNTGFTIGLYDISGNPTTGYIDWYAQGY